MATYDLTASTTATGRPSRMNPGVRTPYLVENTVDISKVEFYFFIFIIKCVKLSNLFNYFIYFGNQI